jgi:DNA-binding CsgD family transcriptional regulator
VTVTDMRAPVRFANTPSRRASARAETTATSSAISSFRTARQPSSRCQTESETSCTRWPLGYTNQEIGGKRFIAVPTVDTHRAHIVRKLQLETRAELLMLALADGVIGPNAD